MNTNQNESPFGEVIYSYTRKQAIADGVQVSYQNRAGGGNQIPDVFDPRRV
jgi:type I site-specific restriction endonuclease